MKYSMIIADDEILTLKSEELRIRKEFPEIEILGTAQNGIAFKEMVTRLKPDLAIVDIRMPGLSGLEVIRLLRDAGCKTHFVVNTAFSDFEYVKSAFDLKTDGFLVKPCKREEFVKVITEICNRIETEKKQQEDLSRANSIIQMVSPLMGDELLLSIFSSQVDEESFNLYCHFNSIQFYQGFILTLLPKYKNAVIDRKKIREAIRTILNGVCDYLETVSNENVVIMIFIPVGMKNDDITQWKREVANRLSSQLENNMGITFLSGTGGNYDRFRDMMVSYQESLSRFGQIEKSSSCKDTEKSENHISRIKEYVELHYSEDISLEDVASEIGISVFYLSHMFKQAENKTFVEYLMNFRVNEAKRLCRETDFDTGEIARRCGFNNTSYFYRVFKKVTGTTIGRYRESILWEK